jgi:hypothetical protein
MIFYMAQSVNIFFMAVMAFSCLSCNLDKDLGDGYGLYAGDRYYSIVVSKSGYYEGGGAAEVIPPAILRVNSNDDYIIAESAKSYGDSLTYFWIINKNHPIDWKSYISANRTDEDGILKSNVVGPLDSAEFYQNLNKNGILLRLKSP